MSNALDIVKSKYSLKAKNFFPLGTEGGVSTQNFGPAITGSPEMRKNLNRVISPQQFARIRNDISSWRAAIQEAEAAYYPYRVQMQRIFQDTILNEQVQACWKKRRDLSLLRKFKICGEDGVDVPELSALFKKRWFTNFLTYAIDTIGFGYTLISLGDIVNSMFPKLTIVRRQNISPDRRTVTAWPNMPGGVSWDDPQVSPWHIYIDTPNEVGSSPCGFGLFYYVAQAEIYLRNNTGYNADFQELFGQPIRIGKTEKTDENEREEFANDLANMGSSAWMLLDPVDDVKLLESKNFGTGYQSFADFEKRLEAKISKVLLGHADAIDSVPGKLGAGQGGEESPAQLALNDIQVSDGRFLEEVINDQLIPRMRAFGFKIPLDKRYQFVNDAEAEEFRKKEDASNLQTATVFKMIHDAGFDGDAKYFSDRTGIPVAKSIVAPPMIGPGEDDEPGPDAEPDSDAEANKPKKVTARMKIAQTKIRNRMINERIRARLKNLYSTPR